jgi:hypothetical protein
MIITKYVFAFALKTKREKLHEVKRATFSTAVRTGMQMSTAMNSKYNIELNFLFTIDYMMGIKY